MKLDLAAPAVACCSPLGAPRLTDDAADATAAVFKALADPHRVRIMNLLATSDDPVCVCDITEVLGLSQSTTSFHLKKLVSSGLIGREQRGTWAYYSVDRKALERLTDVVQVKGKKR
ncbi:MAG: metalloregulator ArsR/SmtB family transcription factor [Actinomycetota bacterium]|nr:metalloregulator ArsR/SmtB family transcription factor [Actinomycetota bacterium]